MLYPPTLSRLIEALRCLPGVGPKSAQRMAFHLLERDRDGAREIAASVGQAIEKLGHCQRCRMFAEGELCPVCTSASRDRSLLCVVESPADVVAIEQSGSFRGCYFVLMGHLSPLDGVGPSEIGIDAFGASARWGRGSRGDPRDESNRGGRGDRALPRRGRQPSRYPSVANRARRTGGRRTRVRRWGHARARARRSAGGFLSLFEFSPALTEFRQAYGWRRAFRGLFRRAGRRRSPEQAPESALDTRRLSEFSAEPENSHGAGIAHQIQRRVKWVASQRVTSGREVSGAALDASCAVRSPRHEDAAQARYEGERDGCFSTKRAPRATRKTTVTFPRNRRLNPALAGRG